MNKSVILTGAAGFVGTRLASRLVVEGFEVHALDVKNPGIPGVVFIDSDISQGSDNPPNILPDNAVFIHLAAVSTDSACRSDPIAALSTNLMGTSRMVMLANAKNSSKFIFASSEWVYPESEISESCLESQDLILNKLSSLYARTKLIGEGLVSNLSEAPSVSLRFGIVYGPRKQPGSAPESILLKVRNGEPIEVGSLETARRYIYVDDLVEGILRVVNSSPESGNAIYNLAGNELISLGELVSAAEIACGKRAHALEVGSKPSIRNPIADCFNRKFEFAPKFDIQAGFRVCLKTLD